MNSAIPQRLGDFELIRELGRGGMGIVYKATRVGHAETIAVKVIRKDRLQHDDDRLIRQVTPEPDDGEQSAVHHERERDQLTAVLFEEIVDAQRPTGEF